MPRLDGLVRERDKLMPRLGSGRCGGGGAVLVILMLKDP